jgi:sec-independent protein translocase protein TatA
MLGQIGVPELVIILVIALMIFGPKKLPSIGKSLGEGISSFKRGLSGKEEDHDGKPQP